MRRRAIWLAALTGIALTLASLGTSAQEPTVEPTESELDTATPEPQTPSAEPEPIAPAMPTDTAPREEDRFAAPPERRTAPADEDAEDEEAADAKAAPLLHGTLELSLADAIRMGIENNLDVQVDRYSPLLADLDAAAAWGAYDPELFAEMFYRDQREPNANVLFGTDINVTRSTDGFGGLRGIVPLIGTQLSGQFEGSRQTFNSSIQVLSPEYNSGWSIDVTQPVLRNLIWNEPWTRVKQSRYVVGASEEGFRTSVMDTVQRIEDAYWALIAREEALRVANKSLDTATALLDQTRTQFEVGVVSKVEVTEAEAGVAQRAVDQIRAENQYRNQQDRLIDLVLGPNLRAASTLEIRPTDRPKEDANFVQYEVNVEGAVSRAFEHRPELAQIDQELKRAELEVKFARNQILPALDGVFSYGESGLSGDQSGDFDPCRFSTDPACASARFGQGPWDNTFEDYDDTPSYVAGARLSIPFPNRVARSTASRREFELARTRTDKARVEQGIIIDVREAARNLMASQEGIVAARESRRAAAEQLRAEEVRLQYGESTPFDVLEREESFAQSERELIEAFQAYLSSVTRLDRAQGTILRNRNIDIADVAPLR